MKSLWPVLLLLVAGCASTFRSGDWPAQPESHWVRSSAAGSTAVHDLPTVEQVQAFGEEPNPVVSIRAAASPDDFHGSKLFDGIDFVLQPLDAGNRPVRKLGHVTVILYQFDPDTLAGTGRELMRWHVSASRMRELWTDGGTDEGYHMKLGWTKRPTVKYVKTEVRFETLQGKRFTDLVMPGSIDQPRYRWLKK